MTTSAAAACAAFERACACDRRGPEQEAITHDGEALQLGLDGELVAGAPAPR